MKPVLEERDFVEAAFRLGCEVEAVKAICAVEAPRGGFVNDLPTILFEGHIFHKYTKGAYEKTHPTLCYPKWVTTFYGKTQDEEWSRLRQAMTLDSRAALMSASWGKFQVMGFNFPLCGYHTVDEFVSAMHASEHAQLDAFVEYIIATGLQDELQDRKWADFARYYNGPLYQRNQYDVKLARAYAKAKAST